MKSNTNFAAKERRMCIQPFDQFMAAITMCFLGHNISGLLVYPPVLLLQLPWQNIDGIFWPAPLSNKLNYIYTKIPKSPLLLVNVSWFDSNTNLINKHRLGAVGGLNAKFQIFVKGQRGLWDSFAKKLWVYLEAPYLHVPSALLPDGIAISQKTKWTTHEQFLFVRGVQGHHNSSWLLNVYLLCTFASSILGCHRTSRSPLYGQNFATHCSFVSSWNWLQNTAQWLSKCTYCKNSIFEAWSYHRVPSIHNEVPLLQAPLLKS